MHNQMNLESIREDDGTLPKYAWPGGYNMLYVMADGEYMCADCANGENGSIARTVNGPDDDPHDGWYIVGYDVYWEGPSDVCVHCGKELLSEYGDPAEDDD